MMTLNGRSGDHRKLTPIYTEGNMNAWTKFHSDLSAKFLRFFSSQTTNLVVALERRSQKITKESVGVILWGLGMPVHDLMGLHPVWIKVVEQQTDNNIPADKNFELAQVKHRVCISTGLNLNGSLNPCECFSLGPTPPAIKTGCQRRWKDFTCWRLPGMNVSHLRG